MELELFGINFKYVPFDFFPDFEILEKSSNPYKVEPVIESAVSPVSAHEPKSSDSNDFPDRPYMSVQEAIKAKDYEAILPFIKANGFNPNQQTMPQNKR